LALLASLDLHFNGRADRIVTRLVNVSRVVTRRRLSTIHLHKIVNTHNLHIDRVSNETGPCSYRVVGVDGSCAKPLNVESYMVIYAANSYTYYY